MARPGARAVLVTIGFSHFCEKARWALDRAGVPFDEERHLPGFHARAVRRRRTGTTSTPLLVLPDGKILPDSRDILRWASDRLEGALYPSPAVAAWEERFHDGLAPDTRRLAYHYLFGHPEVLLALAHHNSDGAERLLFRVSSPVLVPVLRRRLAASTEEARELIARIDRELEEVAAGLGERRYLVDDRFTAADLAFACALAPALLVRRDEGYGAWVPPLDEAPPAYAEVARRWRASPAGRYALRLFAEERPSRLREDCVPE